MARYFSPSTGLVYIGDAARPNDAVLITTTLRDQLLSQQAQLQQLQAQNIASAMSAGDILAQ